MGSSKIREKHSKVAGGKKDQEVAGEILVPGLEEIAQIDKSSLDLFTDIVVAASLKTQVESIRSLVRSVRAEKYEIVSTVLVSWYFHCSGPLKKVLSNCVNSVKDPDLQQLLSTEIRARVSGLTRGPELVPQLLAGFDNFPLYEAAVVSERDSLVGLVVSQLEEEVGGLAQTVLAPVERAALTCRAGASVRLLVHLARSWTEWSDLLSPLSSLAGRIVQQAELPQELRDNCGHILVLIIRLEREERLVEYLQELASAGQTKDGEFSYENCGPVLSLLHGVLSTASRAWLERLEDSDQILSLLLSALLTVSRTDLASPSLLGCSKGVLCWASRVSDLSQALSLTESEAGELWQYVWTSLELQVDSVKHNTKNILKAVVTSLLKGGQEVRVSQLLSQTLQLPQHSKPRLIVLSCLVQSWDSALILQRCPKLVAESLSLLQQEVALAGQVSDLLTSLVRALTETGGDWYETVVLPLLSQFNNNNNSPAVSLALTNLLTSLIKINSQVIDKILSSAPNLPTRLSLLCLKLSRGLGQPWVFSSQEEVLLRASQQPEDEERLEALAVCVESHSSVEIIEERELSWEVSFILSELGLQCPASQQVLTVLTSKMVQRLRDGAAAVRKKLSQKKFSAERTRLESVVSYYNHWLSWFVSSLLDNLYPGANTPRRSSVLEILASLNNIIGLEGAETGLNIRSVLVTEQAANSLLECLHDSYEANKEKALGLLLSLPASVLEHDQPSVVRERLDQMLALMLSSRPASTLTATYLVRLLLAAPALPWVLADRLGLLRASQYNPALLMLLLVR